MPLDFRRKLPIPMEVKSELPLAQHHAIRKAERDWEIAQVFKGESGKRLLVIGPCSADREDAVLEYCTRLAALQEEVADQLIIIPRVYTSKPRTTGAGYKGMQHQPDPMLASDMLEGIKTVRRLHLRVIEQTGFFCADEILYPASYRFVSDLLSYAAIGARSVEDQEHRLIASGLDIPVGMKNPTHGDMETMLNSIEAAQHPHVFTYRNWEVASTGNSLAHAILRGYSDSNGHHPNYHFEDLERLDLAYRKKGLLNPGVIVDCNHSNSGKDFIQQARVAGDVLESCSLSPEINALFRGFMIESYLVEGRQEPGGGVFGQSITDACIGWETTRRLVLSIAESLEVL